MKQGKSLVSVVVPVYNTEKFLTECIDSIVTQTHKNIEIILVNDGSTDLSGMLCDNYARVDKRIKVIHQENHGVSSARNAGIDFAKGSYITFIDADDMIHRDYINYLYNDMINYRATTTTTAAKDTDSRNQELLDSAVGDSEILVLNVDDTMRELYRGKLEGTRNGVQMFSLEMLNDNKIRYDENMAIGEDFDFFARAILSSNKVVVDRRRMYYYRSNPNSVMLQAFNQKQFDAIKNVENIGRNVEDKIPGLKEVIDNMVFSDAVFYGSKVVAVREKWMKEYNEIAFYIKKYRFEVLTSSQSKLNTKIKAFIMIVFGVKFGLTITKRLIRW